MNTLTRREFLKYSALTGVTASAAAILAGCASKDAGTPSGTTTAPEKETATADNITGTLTAGQEVSNAEEVDTTRRTTAETGERYPLFIMPSGKITDMSIQCFMFKASISRLMFEGLGNDNKFTGFPDWIMVKKAENVGDAWGKFTYGDNPMFPESYEECKEGDEGARHIDLWDMEIYDYIKDWDGNNITAEDIVFSFQSDIASGKVFKYQCFIWVEKTGDYTVRFYMDYQEMQAIDAAEHPWGRFTMFSKKGYEAGNYDSNPVATGPYKLTKFVADSVVVLEANDDYWQTDESLVCINQQRNIQTIKFPIITEAEQQINALMLRNVSESTSVKTDDLPLFAEGGEYGEYYNIYRAAASATWGLMFNCYEGHPGNDINFRIACCYAINSEAVAIGAGSSYFALKGAGSPGATDFDPTLDDDVNWQTQFDLEKAKEYMAKTTYGGEELVLLCGTNEDVKNMAQVYQNLLLQINVKTSIQAVENSISEAWLPDPSKWDLHAVSTQGGNFVSGINRPLGRVDFKTEPFIGYADCLGFQNDDELYNLFQSANCQANAGPEATGKLARYIVDNAYIKFSCGTYSNYVYTKDIAELVFNYQGGEVCWNACNFYLDDIIGVDDLWA